MSWDKGKFEKVLLLISSTTALIVNLMSLPLVWISYNWNYPPGKMATVFLFLFLVMLCIPVLILAELNKNIWNKKKVLALCIIFLIIFDSTTLASTPIFMFQVLILAFINLGYFPFVTANFRLLFSK